jgi:TusA-related sulfurtransferase
MARSSGEERGGEPDDSDAAELDLRGEICPYTFVRTRLALEEMPLGSCLVVLVDHEPASRNIPRSARAWGQEVVSVSQRAADSPTWAIRLVKRVD